MRRIDKPVGSHSAEDIRMNWRKNQPWAGEVNTIRYTTTHTRVQGEIYLVDTTEKAREKGILLFYINIDREQIENEEFMSVLILSSLSI